MKKWYPKILISILTLTLFTLPASASSVTKSLNATYGVQIIYNNQVLSSQNQPFIVNGTTYVPLRMLMEAFDDKTIQWNAASNSVVISSNTSTMESVYQQKIVEKNNEITELKQQIATLENQLLIAEEESDDPEDELEDLEDELNDDDDFEDIDLSIKLDGDDDEVELTVKVDEDEWDDLSTSKQEKYLQEICDDIWEEDTFEDADIDGEVVDGSSDIVDFEVDADDDVELADFDDDLEDLEDDLKDDYEDDWDDEGFSSISISLEGDDDEEDGDIDCTVKINLSTYDDEWDDLSDSTLKILMDDLYDAIDDEYDDADITVYVYDTDDGDNVANYDGSSLDRDD